MPAARSQHRAVVFRRIEFDRAGPITIGPGEHPTRPCQRTREHVESSATIGVADADDEAVSRAVDDERVEFAVGQRCDDRCGESMSEVVGRHRERSDGYDLTCAELYGFVVTRAERRTQQRGAVVGLRRDSQRRCLAVEVENLRRQAPVGAIPLDETAKSVQACAHRDGC